MDSTLPTNVEFTNVSATGHYTVAPITVSNSPSPFSVNAPQIAKDVTLQLSADHATKLQGIIDAIETLEDVHVSGQDLLKTVATGLNRSLDDIPQCLMDIQRVVSTLKTTNHISVQVPEIKPSHIENKITLSLPKAFLWYIILTQTILGAAVAGWITFSIKSLAG